MIIDNLKSSLQVELGIEVYKLIYKIILLTSITTGTLIFAFFMMLFGSAIMAGVITFVIFLFVKLTDNQPKNYLKMYFYTLLFFSIITLLFWLIIITIIIFF